MRISKVSLDSIHISTTYGGSLEGLPPKKWIVDSAKRSLVKMFGDNRPTHVIIPDGDRLPKYQYIAWFSSYDTIKDDTAMGSHLFLIWWDDKQTLDGVVDFGAAHWAHADDYWI